MSQLFLVRHGQASFLADNYDQLSELGELQARRLGEYWLQNGFEFDEIYVGPRERQQKTAEIAGEVFKAAKRHWPVAKVESGLDEHHVDQCVIAGPNLSTEPLPRMRLWDDLQNAKTDADKGRCFQRLFEALASAWVCGEELGIETWFDFQQRVNGVLDSIVTDTRRGRRVAVFTSVGPVTIALQRAIQCSDDVALQTGWRIRNSSITEIVYSQDRLTLDRFNGLPHLPSELWSYR